MKRSFVTLFIILFITNVKAQINAKLIYGSWVKVKTTYSDNVELPDILSSKYTYTKYTFINPDKVEIGIVYNRPGLLNSFDINDSILVINSSLGFTVNEFKVLKLTSNEMALQPKGLNGYNDPQAVKIYFVSEPVYQRAAKFYSDDISKLSNGDTIYRESPKVYALFNGDEDLLTYLSHHHEDAGMDGQEGILKATFIITKTGKVDSLKILHGINKDYDKQFVKWFNKNTKNW